MEFEKKKAPVRTRRFLGEILVDVGAITLDNLAEALKINKATGKKIGQALVEMGMADDLDVATALSQQLSIPLIDIDELDIHDEVISLVPPEIVKIHLVVPVARDPVSITLVMANPLDMRAIDDVRFATQLRVEVALASEADVISAIEKYYPGESFLNANAFKNSGEDQKLVIFSTRKKEEEDKNKDEDLLNLSGKPPVVRFTNAILSDAIKLKASDIHVEPRRKSVVIRYRIDGVMREIMQTERKIHSGMVTRIKVLSSMDISVRRAPQDGKFQVQFGNDRIDIRVSTLPTKYGEKITMRILNAVGAPDSIEQLDFSEQSLEKLKEAISRPQGIVLITGPTGSGKTTTLYTCLKSVMSPKVNIITLENPIEYELEGITQVEINPKQGLSFADGLRSVLRQDPDILLVGEIRDKETATIAFHAAQTGHLVLSTLHTNSALATISRLQDLGIEPFQISSILNAVVSQRLVRRLCENCKQEKPLDDSLRNTLPPNLTQQESKKFWSAEGCDYCNSTGYVGRVAIHEVLHITPSIRELIIEGKNIKEIERAAVASGFINLTADGVSKALNGLTTLSEIYRVAPHSSEDTVESDEIETTGIESESKNLNTQPVQSNTRPTSDESSESKKILLVDDEQFMLQFLQGVLQGEGYLVNTAVNGVEGLKIAEQEIPDLIITDYKMPEMDGVQMVLKLRSISSTSNIPTIILTGVDDVDSEIEGLKSGADDYLIKPINARKLIARVNRLLERQATPRSFSRSY